MDDIKKVVIKVLGKENLTEVEKKILEDFFKVKNDIKPLSFDVKNSSKPFLFSNKRLVLLYLIPSKRREEIIGDLIETKMQMIEEGLPLWKIKMVLCFHVFFIVIGLFRMKLLDYGKGKKEVEK